MLLCQIILEIVRYFFLPNLSSKLPDCHVFLLLNLSENVLFLLSNMSEELM